MNWYLEVLKKYAQFDGRARRMEYWVFALVNCLVSFVLCMLIVVPTALHGDAHNPVYAYPGIGLLTLYSLAVFIPGLAVSVRRLHDSGKSGWFLLIGLVPFVGGIILLIFMFMGSQPGPNQYGPNPKEVDGSGQFAPVAARY